MADTTQNGACSPDVLSAQANSLDAAKARAIQGVVKNATERPNPQAANIAKGLEASLAAVDAQRAKINELQKPPGMSDAAWNAMKEGMLKQLTAQQEAILEQYARMRPTTPGEQAAAAQQLMKDGMATMKAEVGAATGCGVSAPAPAMKPAEKNTALEEQKTQLLTTQAELKAVDLDGNHKITKAEVVAAVVMDWDKENPTDIKHAKFNEHVRQAVAIRQEVNRVTSSNDDQSPRAEFIRQVIVPVLGHHGQVGTERVFSDVDLQALSERFLQLPKEEMKSMLESCNHAIDLENRLTGKAGSIAKVIEDNSFKLTGDKELLSSKNRELAQAQGELEREIGSVMTPEQLVAQAAKAIGRNGKPELSGKQLDVIKGAAQGIPGMNPDNYPNVQRMRENSGNLKLEVAQMSEIVKIRKEMAQYKLDPELLAKGVHVEDVARALAIVVDTQTPPAQQR